MGNNASCKVAGIRIVHIKMFDGVVRTLDDVKHVPGLKRNLISLSTHEARGHKYIGEGGVLKTSCDEGSSKDNHVICHVRFHYYRRCCFFSFIIRGGYYEALAHAS